MKGNRLIMEHNIQFENLLCFKIYAASRIITKIYNSELKKFNLTYPQYLVLVSIYEKNNISVTTLGKKLNLDSGTLTPLLKRMQKNDFIIRKRFKDDERIVLISLTKKAISLKPKIMELTKKLHKQCQEFGCDQTDKLQNTIEYLDDIIKYQS